MGSWMRVPLKLGPWHCNHPNNPSNELLFAKKVFASDQNREFFIFIFILCLSTRMSTPGYDAIN